MTVQVMQDGVLVSLSDAQEAAISPPSAPVLLNQTVTRTQGMLALNAAGLLAQVQSAISAADEATQIWFNTAPIWERQNPIILSLANTLSLSPTQVDALFVQAASL